MYPVYAKGRNVHSQDTILWTKHVIRIFSLSFVVYGKLADTSTGSNFTTIFNKWRQHHHPPQHAAIWMLPTVCAGKSSGNSHYLWLIITGLQPQCPCNFAQPPSAKISQTRSSSLPQSSDCKLLHKQTLYSVFFCSIFMHECENTHMRELLIPLFSTPSSHHSKALSRRC